MSFNYFNYPTVGGYRQFGCGPRPFYPRRGFESVSYQGLYQYNNLTGERKLDIVDVGLKVGAGIAAFALLKNLFKGGKNNAPGSSIAAKKIILREGDLSAGNGEGSRNSPTGS